MKTGTFKLLSNKKIAENTFEWVLESPELRDEEIGKAGQFVNIKLEGFYLRRPISVCNVEGNRLTLIFKAVGEGTEKMARSIPNEVFDVMTGLGNGYELSRAKDEPLLIGGGAGVPPMYLLARELTAGGKKVTVILGFNTKSEVFYREKFEELGCRVIVATADGSEGVRGFVTNAMDGLVYSYFYTCGPEPMLKAVYYKSETDGEFSFEERMGCGFGACMGCSCETKYKYKRICRDGPVLLKEEIVW